MTLEQKRIIELTKALGYAIGALEVIYMSPDYFDRDGLVRILNELKQVANYSDNEISSSSQ